MEERRTFIKCRGLTLTELLLALAILTFVLSGLLNIFVNCIFLNDASRNLTLAMSHAQYVMENIKNSDFTTLESEITSGGWDWNKEDVASHNLASLPDESIDTNVFQSPNPLGVAVSVDWTDRRGRAWHRELHTLITDY